MSINLAVGQTDKPSPDDARRTPDAFIDLAHIVMCGIDLDPASDQAANERVRASRIFTIDDNGLFQDWGGRVFLNPPGGRIDPHTLKPTKSPINAASSVAIWWAKLVHEAKVGNVKEAIFVCFSLEAMMTTQKFVPDFPVYAFPFVVPRKRYDFPASKTANSGSPPGASAVIYIGEDQGLFLQEASKIGFAKGGYSLKGLRDAQSGT